MNPTFYRWLAATGASLLGLTLLSFHRMPVEAAALRASSTRDDCAVREVSRQRITIAGGRQVYVEPVAVAAASTGLLVVGRPVYIWAQDQQGNAMLQPSRHAIGVIIDRYGEARIIPAPVNANLVSGIRAVTLPNGKWGMVFAELTPPVDTTTVPKDLAARLWYGIYDGSSWSKLDELPRPRNMELHPFLSSSLARNGDSLAWAMTATTPAGNTDVVVIERRHQHWSFSTIPTQDAGYVDASYSKTLGLLLAITRGDPLIPAEGRSLVLYARQPQWKLIEKIVPGIPSGIHSPVFSTTTEQNSLSWLALVQDPAGARFAAVTTSRGVDEGGQRLITVDSAVAEGFTHLYTSEGYRLWLSDHAPAAGGQRMLRFSRDSAGAVSVIGQIANPFSGRFGATAYDPFNYAVVGPLVDLTQGTVVSLLIRAQARCRMVEG